MNFFTILQKEKMQILIAGDSFAAKWHGGRGWVDKLEKRYNVTNIAQGGVSEYKILKQLETIDHSKFDIVIVSHTSPYRVHTPNHPLHKTKLHANCDLIANDIMDRYSLFNNSLRAAQGYIKYHFDEEYYIDIYKLIRSKILDLITAKYISMSHLKLSKHLTVEPDHMDFYKTWQKHRGNYCHYDDKGNSIVYNFVKKRIRIYNEQKN